MTQASRAPRHTRLDHTRNDTVLSLTNTVQLLSSTLVSSTVFQGVQSGWNCSLVKGQLNKVSLGGSLKAAASTSPAGAKDVDVSEEPKQTALASEETISEFVSQVASLVKLVDSKDIVELQLKQLDCEVLIRKKEALPPPPSPPVTYYQSQPQPAALPPVSAPSPGPAAAASTPAPSPPKAQPPKSSHPPLKSPMAGTFYRSPAPGEPPFVKVGDKVKKGQVVCIIEAMKLMNEIEADQAGTVVDVVAEDGKPVSVDTPLFVIEP
ncbi:biotin carboxyl carrier protein of acetyl-CoA carboxylase, chloroplastic-like [Salvia hispanica]|uniref:biotin carboxyl carrier protein of acetyl-CoA carboxylase, chloroplastic-like n=1 Tax=Salvia hispanica TaxID=49212 RepID=UPI0020097A61|nr:biotin carboxyl carrier protein of acetyl-CoA carboxylase, chloroplastic-like [Salvia hispanica]